MIEIAIENPAHIAVGHVPMTTTILSVTLADVHVVETEIGIVAGITVIEIGTEIVLAAVVVAMNIRKDVLVVIAHAAVNVIVYVTVVHKRDFLIYIWTQ